MVKCRACRIQWKIPEQPNKPLADYYNDAYAADEYWNREQEAVRAFEKIRDHLVAILPQPGQSLLDVGCGPGLFLSLARAAGFQATGIELNPTLAQRATKRASVEVMVGDILTADFCGRQFDVVTLLDLIEHIAEPRLLLRRVRQLLNPRGHVVIFTPNHSSLIIRIAELLHSVSFGRISGPVREIFDGVHVVFFDPSSLRRVLEAEGFHPVRTVRMKYDPGRSRQATGVSAMAVRVIETISPLVQGQARVLSFAHRIEVMRRQQLDSEASQIQL